ncbi:MAG: DUF2306 domain-containing protein [Bacteroidota bacterium]
MFAKPTSNWRGPALLLTLGTLNILFGALQLGNIYQGDAANADLSNDYYHETPIPIVLHIVAGIVLNLLGPFQFATGFRARRPGFHRWSGRLLVLAGVLVGITGLWMNEIFPPYGGLLKYSGIVAHSVGILIALFLAMRFILNRQIAKHRVWMMRAVAIGLGPATQRLFVLPVFFITGNINEQLIGLVVWGSLFLNLLVVEWILYREKQQTISHIHPKQQQFI